MGACLSAAALALPTSIYAQDEAVGEDAELDALASEDLEEGSEEAPVQEEPEDPAKDSDPPELDQEEEEKKSGTQLLLGMRYRAVIVPKFLINMFGVDGGRTEVVNGLGPEVGAYWGEKGDGFMVIGSLWHAWYGLEQTPFKGPNDPATAWEVIQSDMRVWYLTVDALWDHRITEQFGFNLGLGVGVGFVAGNLYRNEAFQDPNNPQFPAEKDWPNLSLCPAPGNPSTGECPFDGNYDIVQGTSSDRWPVYPWLNFQMGLRYQPVDEFIGRLELGLGSSGFWLGLGADYSLWL